MEHAPRLSPLAAPQRGAEGALARRQLRLLQLTRRVAEFLRWRASSGVLGDVPHQIEQLWGRIQQDTKALLDGGVGWARPLRLDSLATPQEAQFALRGLWVFY